MPQKKVQKVTTPTNLVNATNNRSHNRSKPHGITTKLVNNFKAVEMVIKEQEEILEAEVIVGMRVLIGTTIIEKTTTTDLITIGKITIGKITITEEITIIDKKTITEEIIIGVKETNLLEIVIEIMIGKIINNLSIVADMIIKTKEDLTAETTHEIIPKMTHETAVMKKTIIITLITIKKLRIIMDVFSKDHKLPLTMI